MFFYGDEYEITKPDLNLSVGIPIISLLKCMDCKCFVLKNWKKKIFIELRPGDKVNSFVDENE